MTALGPRAQPPHRWRVPYVVVMTAGGGSRLKDLVVAPEALMRRGSGLVLNAKYYIEKVGLMAAPAGRNRSRRAASTPHRPEPFPRP